MKITVDRDALLAELERVKPIPGNGVETVLLRALPESGTKGEGRLALAATDLDVSLRCGCVTEVEAAGAAVVPARKFHEIVHSMPDGARLEVEASKDARVRIESGAVVFRLAGTEAALFPALPDPEKMPQVEIPAGHLRELIARTSFAITQEDARYYLAGALMVLEPGAVTMVTTDGHRLAYNRIPATLGLKEATEVLVPRKAIEGLGHLLDGAEVARFARTPSHLFFEVDGRRLSCKTIEGQFPAFRKIIDAEGENRLVVGRAQLAAALRRVAILSNDRSRAVRLSAARGALTLLASNPDAGEGREQLSVGGYDLAAALKVCFNASYVLDFLGAAEGEQVQVALTNAESHGMLRPLGEGAADYRYLVMPMRL